MLNTRVEVEHPTDPFTMHLAQGLLTADEARSLYETAPLHRTELIARTDPAYEKQYRMNLYYLVRDGERVAKEAELAGRWTELVDDLLSEPFMDWLEGSTGLELRGLPLDVGVYTHVDGDFISVHKDKPNKAITAILYLNEDWPAGAGGEYEVRISGDPADEPVRRIAPRAGQFLAFPPTETSWHAVSPVRVGPGTTRLTVQLEFWFPGESSGH